MDSCISPRVLTFPAGGRSSKSTRYLAIVTMMDIAVPEAWREPSAYVETLRATSHEEAKALAEAFALDLARGEAAWLDEAEGLAFREAQAVLRANGFYLGTPHVEQVRDANDGRVG